MVFAWIWTNNRTLRSTKFGKLYTLLKTLNRDIDMTRLGKLWRFEWQPIEAIRVMRSHDQKAYSIIQYPHTYLCTFLFTSQRENPHSCNPEDYIWIFLGGTHISLVFLPCGLCFSAVPCGLCVGIYSMCCVGDCSLFIYSSTISYSLLSVTGPCLLFSTE